MFSDVAANSRLSFKMASWKTYGLSALSNVTQSVQALSSYAQVVLHEAREEVNTAALFDAHAFAPFPATHHINSLQVESELLGEGNTGTVSRALEDGADAAAVAPAPAPRALKPFSSPLRPLTANYNTSADEAGAIEISGGDGTVDFDSADDPQQEILQLQVRLPLQFDRVLIGIAVASTSSLMRALSDVRASFGIPISKPARGQLRR